MRPLPLSSSKHSLSSRFPPRADPRRNPVESRREMRRVRLRLRRPGYVDCAHFDGVMSRAVEVSLRGAHASKLSFCDPIATLHCPLHTELSATLQIIYYTLASFLFITSLPPSTSNPAFQTSDIVILPRRPAPWSRRSGSFWRRSSRTLPSPRRSS